MVWDSFKDAVGIIGIVIIIGGLYAALYAIPRHNHLLAVNHCMADDSLSEYVRCDRAIRNKAK